MYFRVLGPLEVLDRDRPVAVGTGKRSAVLALLLLNANEVVSLDRIVDGLWGEAPPATAQKSVQVHVSQLRKALRAREGQSHEELLVTRPNGYLLRVDPDSIDAHRFERALAAGQRLLGESDPAAAAGELDAGLRLWRGPPLADFTYERFAENEISRLEDLRLVALETRVEAGLALGEHARLVGELEALVLDHPMRERFQAQLMVALYRSGRQADALAVYRDVSRVLRDELGLEPTRALRELEQRILAQDSGLMLPPEMAGAGAATAVREPPPATRPEPGEAFAGYEIESLIGRGGMGRVYQARHVGLGRRVALKLIAPELAADPVLRERFKQESQLAASIDHPNVIPIYEAGECEGVLFISMRLVRGTDMRELIECEGALDPERAAAIVRDLAAALDAAHRRGLVHRDVKPANVLISEDDGQVYLTDFGLMKRVSESGITQTGQVVGTLDFVAPEQIRGGAVDARADVYSLGCMLFHALAGELPFPRDSAVAKLYAHLHETPPALSERVPGLPPALDDVVARAMAKDPEHRYGSAGELAGATMAAASGESAPASAPARRALDLLRPVPLLAIGGAVLAAATLAAIAQRGGEDAAVVPGVDVTTNSVVAVDARRGAAFALPLPGRATDLAVAGGTAWIVTVDSSALSAVDARTRRVTRTVALGMEPAAVALAGDSVWVADATRGLIARLRPGYDTATRIRYDRSDPPAKSSRTRRPPTSLAGGPDAVWLADGSSTLHRFDGATGRSTAIRGRRSLDRVAFGAGAVWALSSRDATVVRFDSRTGAATGAIAIAGRRGSEAPFPVAIAATRRAVWVLNRNTATVTRIDPATLSVVTTIPVGLERIPTDLAAAANGVWVSNRDGSVSRIDASSNAVTSLVIGEALDQVGAGPAGTWVTTTDIDQQLPGGDA